MHLKVFKYHLPALIIIGVVVLIGYFAYPHLPDLIPTHFDISGKPDHYSEKGAFVCLYFAFIIALFCFTLAFDLFYLQRVLRGKMMAATNWGIQSVMAVVYLSSIAYTLGIIDNLLEGMAMGFIAVGAVFTSLYFNAKRKLDDEVVGLDDSPYFERVKLSPTMILLFFARPFFPNYIVQTREELRILGTLYDFRRKWDEIESIRDTNFVRTSFFPIKLTTRFSGVVEIVMKKRRSTVIITPEDKEAFMKGAEAFLFNTK